MQPLAFLVDRCVYFTANATLPQFFKIAICARSRDLCNTIRSFREDYSVINRNRLNMADLQQFIVVSKALGFLQFDILLIPIFYK